VASDNITQYAELVEENEKFLRLLQILGEQVEGTKKVIVFVDTQVRADNIFEQLLRNGYPSLSLHGGKEQEDRDSTISDFKRKDGPNILVATGVAGRGLDVPACSCVINYSAPNHLEAYVHQVGRTGRAGNRGVAYTFVNSGDESKFAPSVVRALSEAGQSENISPALQELAAEFKVKVEKGEARYASSGFQGKGYSYDSTEMSEAQTMARMEKRLALIEAGLLDPDDDDPFSVEAQMVKKKTDESAAADAKKEAERPMMEIPDHLTPELLALPGMKEALLRKAGIVPAETTSEVEDDDPSMGHPVRLGDNHWLQEFEINEYPREARWKVTQKETTSRLQDEFRTAVTLKGSYFPPGRTPSGDERLLYLHLEATSESILKNCVSEIQRLLNEETLRVGAKASGSSSHKYNVLG
jgi:ATP-dependent RNA helicase DDX46/PRP5